MKVFRHLQLGSCLEVDQEPAGGIFPHIPSLRETPRDSQELGEKDVFFYLDVSFICIFGANNHMISEISWTQKAKALYCDAQIYLLRYSVLTCCGGVPG